MVLNLYEINAAVWFHEQPWSLRERPDLAGISDCEIDEWAELGIDMVWFLGAWRKGGATGEICRDSRGMRRAFNAVLPGVQPDDIVGSPFSIADYSIDPSLGDAGSLGRLRSKLHARGLGLMLDFVPNHLAVDHPWVASHPERFVWGSEDRLLAAPENYFRAPGDSKRILAHGRDPYFAGWTDTAQINIFSRDMRAAMIEQLMRVAEQCDGVRCDMAMLVTNDVFRKTWGDLSLMDYPEGSPSEFWEEAIAAVRKVYPDFIFLAEVYWDLERHLQQMGFDYTYDKTLYDRLLTGDGAAVRAHLRATSDCQEHLARFIENHDESRAADAFDRRQAAAAVFMTALPGLHLYHEGQFDGRRIRVPVQLQRRPGETLDADVRQFYARLLRLGAEPVMRAGAFRVLEVREAWRENLSDRAIAACWRADDSQRRLVAVNIGHHQAQAYVEAPVEDFDCKKIQLRDLLNDDCRYERDRIELLEKGLYLDMPSGGYHVFSIEPVCDAAP